MGDIWGCWGVNDIIILAAVIHYLGMSSFDDCPLASIVAHDTWMKSDLSHHIVNYVALTVRFSYAVGVGLTSPQRTQRPNSRYGCGSVRW
jgi:hypothetical protein